MASSDEHSTKPIKVLHLIDSGGLYGAEIVLLNLVEAQVKLGLSVLILSAGEQGAYKKPFEVEAEKRCLPLKILRMKSGFNVRKSLEISRFAYSEDFDLIHSHGFKFNFLLGFLPKKIIKIPVLTTVHGYVIPKKLSKLSLYLWLDRLILPRLSGVVFVNSAMKEQPFFKGLKLNKCFVVDNGIDVNPKDLVIDTHNCDLCGAFEDFSRDATFLIAAVGRLAIEKGFFDLLEALAIVHKAMPGVKLVIFGDGPLKDELTEAIKVLGLSDCVLLAGYSDNVLYFLSKVDAFVLSSHTEGLPIILLEAMSLEVPVVATKVGGVPQVLEKGKCGVLVDAKDVGGIAKGLAHLFSDRDASKKYAELGKIRVKEHYSKLSMAAKYSEVYADLLKGVKF